MSDEGIYRIGNVIRAELVDDKSARGMVVFVQGHGDDMEVTIQRTSNQEQQTFRVGDVLAVEIRPRPF